MEASRLDAEGMRNPKVRGVLVVGMHRGGTSAVTELLSRGFELYEGRARARRLRGYPLHEISKLSLFNEGVLQHYGGSWDNPPDMNFSSVIDQFGKEALALHLECLSRFRISWVWKDPRTSLLLPLWREVLGEEGLYIVVVQRRPEAVAASLCQRDRTWTMTQGISLHSQYWDAIEAGIKGSHRIVVDYDDLLDHTLAACESISEFLGIPFSAQKADWALQKRLRHHV